MLRQDGDCQPGPWAQRCHGFSRSGGAHEGLAGVTSNSNIKTMKISGPLLATYFSPGPLGGGDTEERFHNRIFKPRAALGLRVPRGPLGSDRWRERLCGGGAQGSPTRQKSELPMNCFMSLCLDMGILAKNGFAGRHCYVLLLK